MRIKLGICRPVMIMILTVIVFGGNTFLETPAQLCRGNSELFATVIYPVRAEAAPAEFDVDSLAEILGLFDVDSRYARLKTRFIENFEKLPPESRNKVIQMYLGGKKEQPDKLLLMKGMSATASFLRGVEVARNIIREYQTTGVIKEDGDFMGIASGSAIVEYFPRSSVRLIPLLANPADVDKLIAMMRQTVTDSIAKNRAEIAEMKKRIAFMQEITDMINKALGK